MTNGVNFSSVSISAKSALSERAFSERIFSERVLIVGSGRLASFFQMYLNDSLPTLPVNRWSRSSLYSFKEAERQFKPTHIWLCISDDAIEDFVFNNSDSLHGSTVVHFAGAKGCLDLTGHTIFPAHPLMSFPKMSFPKVSAGVAQNDELQAGLMRQFRQVSFALSPRQPLLTRLLPGFENPCFIIEDELRPLYHAYCALAANFTVLLWEEIEARWRHTLKVDVGHLNTLRNQIFDLLATQRDCSILTGPIARGDAETLRRQQQALLENGDPALSMLLDTATALYRSRNTAPNFSTLEVSP